MNATKKILTSLIAAAFILSSCQKDLDLFVPDPGSHSGADSTWYNNVTGTMPVAGLKNDLLLHIQKDSFQVGATAVIVNTANGMQCSMNAGSLVSPSNHPVVGKVYLESLLLKKKGDMIRMGTPTVSEGKLLVSGGELFLSMRNDSFALQFSQNSNFFVEYPDTGISTQMNVYNGITNIQAPLGWQLNDDTAHNQVFPNNQSYLIKSNRLNWINCAYLYDTAGIQQTIVSASLPAHYTNANTIAYTVFNDMRSVVGMFGNEATKKFSSGKLPVNKQVTVVVISKQGNDYYLGHAQTTTSSSSTGSTGAQQVTVNPVITSFNNILAYLESL
jgi:hypothetical protein